MTKVLEYSITRLVIKNPDKMKNILKFKVKKDWHLQMTSELLSKRVTLQQETHIPTQIDG